MSQSPEMIALQAEWRAFLRGEAEKVVSVPLLSLTREQRALRDRLIAKAERRREVDRAFAEVEMQMQRNRADVQERKRRACSFGAYVPIPGDPFEAARAGILARRGAGG